MYIETDHDTILGHEFSAVVTQSGSNSNLNIGDKVVVNGITYTAKWWSQGQNPESSSAWSKPYVAGSQWKINDTLVKKKNGASEDEGICFISDLLF